MTASELIDRIVADPTRAAVLLQGSKGESGISRAFFDQVYKLFVEDHSKLAEMHSAAGLVVRYGDDPALGYRSLGIVERTRGKWLASALAFQRAGDLATEPHDRLSYKIGAIDGLARSGRIGQALKLGHALADGLNKIGEKGQAARARLNLGYALMEQDRYKEAADELKGLPSALRQSGFLSDSTSSRLALSTSLLFGGSATEAWREAQSAADEATSDGSRLLANIALGNVAYAEILRGNVDTAVTTLLKLNQEHLEEPVERARVLEYLGDAYVSMNLFSEAADAYRDAEAIGVYPSSLHRAHLRLGMGEALLAAGSANLAIPHLKYAAELYRRLGNAPWFAAAQTDLACAGLELNEANAPRRLRRAVEFAKRSANPYHLCRALIASAENGDPESDLDLATKLCRQPDLRRFLWRVYAERARRSDGTERLRWFRKMFKAILEDQVRTSSISARLHFLVDKQEALQLYIDELLRSPKPAKVQEAISVITQSRAVTLLDEVILGRRGQLPEAVLGKLSELREELNRGGAHTFSEGSRRASPIGQNLDHLQRLWMEQTHVGGTLPSGSRSSSRAPEDSLLFLSGAGSYRAISNRGVIELPMTEAELEQHLMWLNYDILGPMADKGACTESAMAELRAIGERLIRPILDHKGVLGICPDGVLWRVPWTACLDAIGEVRDLELRLHPALNGHVFGRRTHSAMVWVADHADLLRAKEEAAAFLAIYPRATVCTSANEVREALKCTSVSLLHVITHARHRDSHPMFSSLDFTDGPVLAAEIARSGMQVDLVTLSGCDTARVSGVNRLEPDGLVRAFLACGAGYVVGSAWPLDDEAAMRFYSTFFRAFESTAKINQSLRIARQAVRSWKSHPYYWAFPLLYAGYRS